MATARDAVQCLMLCVAVLAGFSCMSRPDVNFPLYLYLWWAFFHVPEDRKALILAFLLVPGITANTAELTKRWGGGNGIIQLEMPTTEPQTRFPQTTTFGVPPVASGPGMPYAY
ncbi:hypothetical protein Emag_006627 [Eimeria magna]